MFLGRQADRVDVPDLGVRVSRGDCRPNRGDLAFGCRRLAEDAESRPGIILHVELGLDDIHARQVADDSLDLDMCLATDDQHMIALGLKAWAAWWARTTRGQVVSISVFPADSSSRSLPIADPVRRDQHPLAACTSSPERSPVGSCCIANPCTFRSPSTTSLCTSWPRIITPCGSLISLDHLQGVADAEAHSHDFRSDHTHRVSPSRLRSASPVIDPGTWLGYVHYLAIQSIIHKGDRPVPGHSCGLTSSSFRTIQTGDHPSARLEVEVVLEAALRASSTTVSRTLMYSRNRRRPSSVIRQRVWGRFL